MDTVVPTLPNLRHLQTVSLIVAGNSLRRTAEILSVSQPSLTLALARLEQHFAADLFHHTPPRLAATEFGVALAARTDRAFAYVCSGLRDLGGPRFAEAGVALALRCLTASRIRALVAVAGSHDLTEAAEVLAITPASLRRTLVELEDAIGLRLFLNDRDKRDLSSAGRTLAERFHLALREIELAQDDMNDIRGQIHGRITVGMAAVAGVALMPPVVARMSDMLPRARMTVVCEEDAVMRARVLTGEIDLICMTLTDNRPPKGLDGVPLYTGELRVLARSDHPLARWPGDVPVAELARYPWLVPKSRSGAADVFRTLFEQAGVTPPNPSLRVKAGEHACNVLRKSNFLAMASRPLGMPAREAPGLHPLNVRVPASEETVWVMWRDDWRPTALQLRFRDTLLQEAQTHVPQAMQMAV